MFRRFRWCWVALVLCALGATADEPKKEPADTPLKRAELKPLEGVWELELAEATGWWGTIRAEIRLSDQRGLQPDLGAITYTYHLRRGVELYWAEKGGPGPRFTGLRRGKDSYLVLVTDRKGGGPPAAGSPGEDVLVKFEVGKDTLTLYADKSAVQLLRHEGMALTKSSWGKTQWRRVSD